MDTRTLVTEVKAYVQRHLPQYINELSRLCAIDSPSSYKPGLDELAYYLRGRMRDLGMDAKVVERDECGNDVLGVLRGSGKGTGRCRWTWCARIWCAGASIPPRPPDGQGSAWLSRW